MKRHPHSLISRRNYRETRRFLEHCADVLGNSDGTVNLKRKAMDHMLEWATDIRLTQAPYLRPTLPNYLATLNVSVSYHQKLVGYARQFFKYARRHWPGRYEEVTEAYLESLVSNEKEDEVKEPKIYTLEEVRALVSVEPRDLTEERTRAAVAFLFLSGMRVSAFVSLPLLAIHWDQSPVLVEQHPKIGVRTKNRKPGNTYLLANPELEDLREIARQWHNKVLTATHPRAMYYAILTPYQEFDEVQVPGDRRGGNVRDYLEDLCERAGVDYRPTHAFRHGHAVYALKKATTMAEMKAISQNLMHESLSTTDEIYSRLINDDVAAHIAALGQGTSREEVLLKLAEEFFQAKIGQFRR